MARLVLLLVLALACASPDPPAEITVTRRGDLTIESRALPADATLEAVGLRPGGDRREGASEWETSFVELAPRIERDGIRREFRLTVVNRSATARELHARIDWVGADGSLVRRKSLKNLVLTPFTETSWSGAVLLPSPGDAQALARVLPASQPFDPEAAP